MRLRTTPVYYLFAALLIAAVLTWNTYRAATQSITIDEAFTYTEFVASPLRETLARYDANQHLLFTLAAKVTTALFPVSEFSLRLPTVIAGAVFLAAVCLLCARALGPALLFAAAIGLVALNPFVLDYLSAARGYGLALAFWFSGLLAMVAGLRRSGAPRLMAAGALCGMLSVAANLTFAFPTVGLLGMTFVLLLVSRHYRAAIFLFVPVLLVGALLLVSPLHHARPAHFYHGAGSVSESIASLGAYSFFYDAETFTLAGMPYWLNWPQRRLLNWLRIALAVLASGVLAVVLRGVWRWRRGSDLDELSRLLTILGGSTLLGAFTLVIAHHLLGVKYPASRTGLFWIVSASLLGPLLAGKLKQRFPPSRLIVGLLGVAGLACAAYLGSQARSGDYAEWRYDAGARDMVRRIDALPHGNQSLRVGVTWTLASSMEFYRRVWKLDWEPVTRMPVENLERRARGGEFDYVVVLPPDHQVLERIGWRRIFRDPRTDAILAVRLPPH